MNLTYLQTFIKVAECGSFTKVAEQSGYAQSSITTQIQKLEQSYGVPLFERFGRKVRLTQAGEALQKYALEMLKLYSESQAVVSSQVSGTLTIGTIETLASFYLPPYIQTLRHLYPRLTISLRSSTEESIIKTVKAGEV